MVRTMRNLLLLLCCCTVVCPLGFGQKGTSELSKTKGLGRAELLELALSDRDPEVARTAFAAFVRSERQAKRVLDGAVEFGKKRDQFASAALHVAVIKQAGTIEMATLPDWKDRGQPRMAAAALSVWAQILYFEAMAEGREPQEDLIEVPTRMYDSTLPDVAAMAITAAAYARVRDQWDRIKEVPDHLAGVPGAKCLYAVLNDVPLEMPMIVAAHEAPARNEIREMGPALTGPHPVVPDAANACFAIGEEGLADGKRALSTWITHEDLRVQIEAARAFNKLGGEERVPAFARVVKGCAWPVLIPVCEGLAAQPDKRVVPLLMQRLQVETGRMRQPILHALGSIAGELHGTNITEWIQWYRESYETFEVDPERSAAFRAANPPESIPVAPSTVFFGQAVTSSRFGYLLDTSELMGAGKIYAVREQTFQSLAKLRKGAGYAIVDFDNDLRYLDKHKLVDDNRAGAFHILDTKRGPAQRRSYDALSRVMAYPELDTVYLATAGPPFESRLPYWEDVRYALYVTQRYRPVNIHVLDIGGAVASANDMKRVTRENGGTYSRHEFDKAGEDERFVKEGD